jgi:PIN domain nuclease of toxin-antitoxin system
LRRYLVRQLARNEFELLPVLVEHAVPVRDLPVHHRDPFDRLLIAQSLTERLALISHDAHEALCNRGALVSRAVTRARARQRFRSG